MEATKKCFIIWLLLIACAADSCVVVYIIMDHGHFLHQVKFVLIESNLIIEDNDSDYRTSDQEVEHAVGNYLSSGSGEVKCQI